MSFAFSYSVLNQNETPPLRYIKGVLSIEGEELLFEYKLYDPQGNVLSTLNKFSINVEFLKSIELMKGLFKAKLIIRTTQLVFLDPLPGSKQGSITLEIKREDRTHAQDFTSKLKIALSERKLRDLE
tara:strand:- start:106908 stop:107288 length:381 start_codon:yes stop_codon:yes gene_type:complete